SLGLAMLVFAGAQAQSWIGRRALPGAGWLAAVSFSLYLTHKPVYGLVEAHFGDALEGETYLAFAVYGIASLLGGAVLHYAVERPGLRLRVRLMRRDASPRAAEKADDILLER
ncbi:MAG: acyltransferase, partial [Lysobacteraceae bacterium]